MKFYKRATLMIGAMLLLSGCNIYRQRMVLEAPYNPSNSTPIVNTSSNVINETLTTNTTPNEQINREVQTKISSSDKTVVQRIPFPVDEYASLATNGSATVTGSVYITTSTGNKVYGKNTRLYLNPVTSYSTQWYQKSYLGGAKMSKVDPRLFNYLKFTTSDSNGKFEFLNIPSGSYYLIGVVKCGTACGYDKVKNIRIAKKISVFGNDVKSVDLSKSVK